ncbi:MAG: hypothetical protein K8R77_03595 [Anaerolineaceae bacterium]|nr:hypothetical protein [Anaerolineaceae bacterium]
MGELVRFLVDSEFWIYTLLGLIGGIYLRKLVLNWQEWRSTIFGLEREGAQHRLVMSVTIVILLLVTAGAELFVVSFVAPSYSMTEMLPTPTLDLMTTPTVTLAPGAAAPLVVPTIAADISAGCIPGVIDWTSPAEGEQISGMVELSGSVNVPNLGFYKYEFSAPGGDNWQTIAAGNTSKVDEPLGGVWNTEQLVPGDYLLRLVVTDNENNAMPPCIIPVRVVAVE